MRTVTHEGLTWLVLDEQGGKTLVITKDVIEKRPYHVDRFCASWEDCSLHTHLAGNKFLLSVEDASRYFSDDMARTACFQGKPWAWWLRDTGIRNHAAYVGKNGAISAHGYRVDCAWCGIRPAMWIN